MKAAVLRAVEAPLSVEELDVPEPGRGQLLVRVHYSGLCRTQLEEIDGQRPDPYLPHLLGHEGAGIVEAVGPEVTGASPGDHVILSWITGPGIQSETPTYRSSSGPVNAGWVTTFNERAIVSEIEKIGIIHLYTLGYREDDLVSFKLQLNNPSRIAELQELEHWRTKFDVAGAATEGFFSQRWIAKNIFNLSDEAHLQNLREMFFDKRHEAALEAVAEGEAAEGGDMGGGDFGDDGDEDLDLGGDEGGDEAGDEDEGPLLAAPARRADDGSYLTRGAKDKYYKPVNSDKRKLGAQRRSQRSQYSDESGRATMRNLYKGMADLNSLTTTTGLSESKGSNYNLEEKMLSVDNDVKSLIRELETKTNETKT